MKFFLHLVRWDVRRFRVVLFAWLLLVAANATLAGLWPALAADFSTRHLAGLVASLLALAEGLLSFVLVALVVQAHAVVGVQSFWITRPIPPHTLLAAKLALLAVVMIVAPVVADIFLMVAYRVQPADIAGVSAQTALFWAFWVVIIMVAAALTPNLAKFALLVGGVLVSIAVVIAVTVALLFFRLEDSPPLSGQQGVNDPTADVVASALTIAAMIALLLVQYRTRLRLQACAIGLAGFAMAYLAGWVWPWPVLAPISNTPPWANDPAMLNLSALPDTVFLEGDLNYGDRPLNWKQARARVRMSGIAPGWTADVGVQEAAVHLTGAAPLINPLPGLPSGVPIEDRDEEPQVREVTRRLLEVDTLVDSSTESFAESTIVLFAPTPEVERVAPAEGTYEGVFRVFLTHHEIEAVLPLRRDAAYHNRSQRFSIIQVQSQAGRVSILTRQSDALSIFERRPLSRLSFYLRNRRESQAIQGSFYPLRDEVSLMRFIPFFIGFGTEELSGFGARAEMIQFPATYSPREKLPFALDEDWMAQAELVIVRSSQQGSVERRLAVANFPIRVQ